MNKKTKNALILLVLTVFCLGIFVGCNQTAPDFFDYSESKLGIMGKLVKWMHSWIGNYGWTVVVFTVFLKIIMLPLDIWQRYAARKSSLKMQQMQPLMDDIDRRYGANTQRANEEKQKLYKKQGFSMMSSCLPMIVSMVIFFIMFGGLSDYSRYSSVTNFRDLTQTYYNTFSEQLIANEEAKEFYYNGCVYVDEGGETKTSKGYNAALQEIMQDDDRNKNEDGTLKTEEEILADLANAVECENEGILAVRAAYEHSMIEDKNFQIDPAKEAAISAAKTYYGEHHESWLWIKNVWQPDTWAPIMQPYKGSGIGAQFMGGAFSSSVNTSKFNDCEEVYKNIRDAVMEGDGYNGRGGWNGLMILPFASIGLSFLSMFISQRMERKNRKGEVVEQNQQQKVTNRTMMIIMPLMMAWFGFIYTGAFAIYMVCNYTLSILSTVALRYPVEKLVAKRMSKDEAKHNVVKAKYKR